MARRESQAVAGYFPTPQAVLDRIVTWVSAGHSRVSICDPCAGEGEAILTIFRHLHKSCTPQIRVCEMEATRYEALKSQRDLPWQGPLHGDAFHIQWTGACGFMWLNPPYDTDPVHKRLEERFLVRAKDMIVRGGWLAFVVPFYALEASKMTLAKHFEDFTCVRFPDEVWGDFRQVILFAKKKAHHDVLDADPLLVAQIEDWARDASIIPTMGFLDEPQILIPHTEGIYNWTMGEMDLAAAKSGYRAWTGVRGIEPPADIERHFLHTYPVASRPRASHLAGAMASGLFNGMRIEPDDPQSTLPPILLKGVFDKEFRHVEDKINSKGEKVAELQVQHPKLTICLLDLRTGIYHNVAHSGEASLSPTVDSLTMRDLLTLYGESLMRGMLRACPVLQDDPAYPDVELPPLHRSLFPAQHVAVQTLLKLAKAKPDYGSVILGEIGSGKSTLALTTALAMGKQRLLILCPPHLLEGWRGEIAVVLPDAQTHFLTSVSEVQAFAASTYDGIAIGLLSRETAKLGHSWTSISKHCPKCGLRLEARDFSLKRETCDHKVITATNPIGKWILESTPILRKYISHSALRIRRGRYPAPAARLDWGLTPQIQKILRDLADVCADSLAPELSWVDPSLAVELTQRYKGYNRYHVLIAAPDISGYIPFNTDYSWESFQRDHAALHEGSPQNQWSYDVRVETGSLKRNGDERASSGAMAQLLTQALAQATFHVTTCGEPLYQAIPEPRRFPLATWIRRFVPKCYDMLIVDESHEYGSRDSAQTQAAQRLMQTKAHILHLTGSFMNGYAESVFMNMWALSPDFRAEFARGEVTPFIDRFGYWKRIVEEGAGSGDVVEYGTQSDRVMRNTRKAGVAPGILPLFNLEHLLPIAVTLQKEDLNLNIPPRSDEVEKLAPSAEQAANFEVLKSDLMQTIKENRKDPERSGKLWGAMAQLSFYYDLASVGNTDGDMFEIRWPENTPVVGGQLVSAVPLLPQSEILPKEQWMLDRIEDEVAEGRNCIVFTFHNRLMPRIVRLVEMAGYNVVMLEASKVPTAKRLDWITQKVVKKKAQVLVVNPVAVQTGLNNLVHFATEIWMENPMCNATVFRQACGRVDRIGQTKPTRIVFPIYKEAQCATHTLLMHKVGVATAVDGLDPEEALKAAGLVESEVQVFSVGRQLYDILSAQDAAARP